MYKKNIPSKASGVSKNESSARSSTAGPVSKKSSAQPTPPVLSQPPPQQLQPPAPKAPLPPPPPPTQTFSKQAATLSTSPTAVQPEIPSSNRERPSFDRSKITEQDLLVQMRHLKKVNRKDVFDPATLDKTQLFRNGEGIQEDVAEFLPLHIARHNVVNMNLTSDLVCLNLSGVEMLTDAFFFVLNFGNTSFRSVKKIICTGCYHLTDLGLKWMAEMSPELMGLELEGCYRVTEKGLTAVVEHCPKLQSLSIVGTNVGRIPLDIGKTKVSSGNLRAHGAPIVSSGFSFISKKAEKKVEKMPNVAGAISTTVKDFDIFKVVVLRDESMTQTLVDLAEKKIPSVPAPAMSITPSWVPDVHRETNGRPNCFSVTEVPAQSVLQDAVVCDGSLVIIAYQIGKESASALGHRLTATIGMLLAKCPDVMIMMFGITNDKGGNELQATEDTVKQRLNIWSEGLNTAIAAHLDQTWKLEMLDFSGQLSLAAGGAMQDTLSDLSLKGRQLYFMSSTVSEIKEVLAEGLTRYVKDAQALFPWVHSPVDIGCFQLMDLVPRKIVHTQHDIFYSMSADDRLKFHEHKPYSHLGKILDMMQKVGSCLYLPGSEDNLCVTDMPAYVQIIKAFLSTSPPCKGSLPCLGESEFQFWDTETLQDFLEKQKADVKVDLFIALLCKQGLILPLPWKGNTTQDGQAEKLGCAGKRVYLLVENMPATHPALERLWPDTLIPNIHHAELFFTVLPGLPASILVSLFRHIMKVLKPLLLWKTGVLLRQGPVDILVQLCYNKADKDNTAHSLPSSNLDGSPVLVISGRLPMMHTSSPVVETSNKILWGALQSVQTICEYVFRKHSLFTFITMPCDLCCNKNVKNATSRVTCFHFHYYRTLAAELRGNSCKLHRGTSVSISEKCGPQYPTIVPFHNYPYLHAASTRKRQLFVETRYKPPDSVLPCFLCEDGIDLLCPCCHVCVRCIGYLSKYEKLVKPGFVRPFMLVGALSKDGDGDDSAGADGSKVPTTKSGGSSTTNSVQEWKVKYRGCLISMKRDQVLDITEPMTPVYFNTLRIIIFRGFDYCVTLHLVDGSTYAYKGMSGLMLKDDKAEKQSSDMKCKEGDLLEIRMTFSKKASCNSTVTFYLNGLNIMERQIEGWEMAVSLKKKVPGACLIQAPGIRQAWHLDRRMPHGSTFELINSTNSSSVSTAIVVWKDNCVAYAASQEKISSYKDPLIRPRGYAKLKGLTLNATPLESVVTIPEGAIQISLPLWGFSQWQTLDCLLEMLQDISNEEDLVAPCAKFLSPSVLFATMERQRQKVEDAIFMNGRIDYTDTAVCLLPRNLSASDLKTGVPSYILICDMEAHPLCYVRGDANSVMTVQPLYNLPVHVECFRLVHMVNNSGFDFPLGDQELWPLLWAWAWMLLYLQREGLDCNDKLLEGISGYEDLSKEQIWQGLQEVIRLTAFLLHIAAGPQLSEYYFYAYDTIVQPASRMKELVGNHLKEDAQKYELDRVTMAFTDIVLHVCPAHAQTFLPSIGITEVPAVVLTTYPQFVYSLLLADNNLTDIPGSVFVSLRNIKDFDLSSNNLTFLREEVGLCEKLETLSVLKNRLSQLPDNLARCTRLGRLEISHNCFTKFPQVITKLKNLRRLYAQNLQLTCLPDDIGELTELRKLYLNGNCFTRLPTSLGRLEKLQDLGLSGVPWCKVRQNQLLSKKHFENMLEEHNLMRWLEQNKKDKSSLFQQFDEDANGTLDQIEIGKLNATIFTLFPRFGCTGSEPTENLKVSGFPPEILQLVSLEYLSLQYQGLQAVPSEISQLKNLSVLNISHNPQLLSVSAQAASLPLKRLELEDCPMLKTPPKEIRAKGFLSIYAFLKRLLSGSVDCKRTKLMLVGLGGAGKTSLVKALMTNTNKADMTIGEEITDGIDICPWTVETVEGPLTFSVWDFAGQTVYYNTHQFFLSDRAVYLLLWNIRLGHEHAGLRFWLSSISVHAPNAPIFVVGTHFDQVSKMELPIKGLKERYPQIVDFHFVSSFSGQGIEQLRKQLIEVTLQEQYMGEKIPGVWLSFEENMKKITDRSVIPYAELEKIANQSGIFEKSEVTQAVQFLHELGSLQHFTNDFLKDQVVINPQWIVDVMACVVSVKDSAIKEGRLRHEDVGRVWKDYPESLHPWLLRLTEEYDLTFPLKDEKVNLVPCLLTEKEPKFEWPELEKGSDLRQTKMSYKFDYLPAGLFNRGQVRLHEFSDSSLIWKRGSYLHKNGHLCLVRQTRDSEMVVRAQGPRPENILLLVHEVFEGLILESFHGVTYDYYVPCPECLRMCLKGPHMFAASTVRRAVELKAPFLQCLKYFHTISISDLQAFMPPEVGTDFDLHLVEAVRGLKELQQELAADIFISFCKKDETSNKTGALTPGRVLKDIEQLGYKYWVAGSDMSSHAMDEMAKALMDATIFLVFMTNAYVSDEVCCNLFKYARLTLRKPLLLVTIGTGFEWKQSRLGILMADEVYVNMQQLERYPSKLEELKATLADRLRQRQEEQHGQTDILPCFISYCWQNSARAKALGTRCVEGAVGFGDPRDIKDFLQEHGVPCWIDVERVGKHGLFDDIGEGLLNARVMLVCVSDEYATSDNCVVEFRFVANTLKLPIVLAVVGSGHKWRATEVGVLSQNYPIVSFQESQSPVVYQRLLQHIQPHLTSPDVQASAIEKIKAVSLDQKSKSFQELCEMAQRKFLRQIVLYAEAQDMYPYPRLFLVDFPRLETDAASVAGDKEMTTGQDYGQEKDTSEGKKTPTAADFQNVHFVVSTLCEHEEGWHSAAEPMLLPPEFGLSLEEYAPFLSRISAIAKYSKHLVMNCMSQWLGKSYLQWLESSPQVAEVMDFQKSYQGLRHTVSQIDTAHTKGNLARCHLPSGRLVWLCKKHQQISRVNVLSDVDSVTILHNPSESLGVDYFVQALRELNILSNTGLTLIPEDITTSTSEADIPPSSSTIGHPGGLIGRASRTKMSEPKPALNLQMTLQREQSQLNFSPQTMSKACHIM